MAGLAGLDEELRRDVALDDNVEVHQGELDVCGCGVGEHAECPRAGLAEVAEAEEPQAGGQVLQSGAGGHDPGRRRPVAVQQAIGILHDAGFPAASGEVENGLADRRHGTSQPSGCGRSGSRTPTS